MYNPITLTEEETRLLYFILDEALEEPDDSDSATHSLFAKIEAALDVEMSWAEDDD